MTDQDRIEAIRNAEARADQAFRDISRAENEDERKDARDLYRHYKSRASLLGERIVQILPADGWQAIYRLSDGKEAASCLVCFALIETMEGSGERFYTVKPMDNGDYVSFCDEDREAQPQRAVKHPRYHRDL
jgi:hypothetical protein